MMFIDASHNMLFTLNRKAWLQDLAKTNVDLVGYQEAEGDAVRSTLAEFCKAHDRGLHHPNQCGNPISWRNSVFSQLEGESGFKRVHLGAKAMGVDAKFNPPRDFSWVGLQHNTNGKKILRINVHPLAGATKRESNPDNRDSPELTAYKDWGFGQYWLDVVAFVAKQAGRDGDQDPRTRPGFWDAILLGGDYNAAMDNRREWYYPANLLTGLFKPDTEFVGGLDHLQHTASSDVKTVKRWKADGNTDHPLHFVSLRFATVADFPRDV